MKLISWNVNGLRACVQKGFLEYFQQVDADVFCIQESKLQEGQIDLDLPGYHQYWNYAVKKGYSCLLYTSSVKMSPSLKTMTETDATTEEITETESTQITSKRIGG